MVTSGIRKSVIGVRGRRTPVADSGGLFTRSPIPGFRRYRGLVAPTQGSGCSSHSWCGCSAFDPKRTNGNGGLRDGQRPRSLELPPYLPMRDQPTSRTIPEECIRRGQTLDALNDHRAFVTLLQAMSFCWTDRPRTPGAGLWFLVVAMMKPPIIGWPDTSERRTCVHPHDIYLSIPPK